MLTSPHIKIMEDAARKAVSKSLIRDYNELENLQVSQKGPGDFVTAADLRVEKILVEELQKARPDYAFLTEEGGDINNNGDWEYRWIIDPIDGTSNFMHGIPFFCISIGLEKKMLGDKTEIIAGLIYAPITDEMFIAEKDNGAFLNDRRIYVSSRKRLGESKLCTGHFFWKDKSSKYPRLDMVEKLLPETSGIRTTGSAALAIAYVAAGKIDGFWCNGLKPWDMAAAMLLVREAKGMVSEFHTSKGLMTSGNILAANPNIHDKILGLLNKYSG